MPNIDAHDLLAVGQAATYIGKGRERTRQLIKAGTIRPARVSQGPRDPYLVERAELDQYIESKRSPSTDPKAVA